MRAALIETLDGPEAVVVRDVPDPAAVPGAVRVRVGAAGVTFPDVLATRGAYQVRPEPPFVPGLEVAGTVVSAPDGSGFSPGDRVAGFTTFGAFADLADVRPEHLVRLPDGTDLVQGAALVVNHFTAHYALSRRAAVRPGETVLVHGAAGGVGTAATQVAKELGCRVLAVVSTPEKAELARRHGADDVLSATDFLAEAEALVGKRGVDVVVDPVGGDRFTDSVRTLGVEGRLLVIGFAAGEIPTVRTNRLLLGNCGVLGVAWAELVRAEPAYVAEQWEHLRPRVADGTYTAAVQEARPLDDVAAVLTAMDRRELAGKAVLTLDASA